MVVGPCIIAAGCRKLYEAPIRTLTNRALHSSCDTAHHPGRIRRQSSLLGETNLLYSSERTIQKAMAGIEAVIMLKGHHT